MRPIRLAGLVVLSLFVASTVQAAILRVVVVQTTDPAAYAKAIEQGKALLKAKGSPIVLRVWRARFAGSDAGAVVASAEYPNLEALAKDDARMATDAELRAWLQGLDKVRKIISDSVYEEVN
jgi:hypothetical protein